MNKELWFDATKISKDKNEFITEVVNRGYTTIILPNSEEDIKVSGRIKKAVYVNNVSEINKNVNADIYITRKLDLAEKLIKLGKKTAVQILVDNKESMEKAANIKMKIQYLIVEFKDTTNIPLELILAKSQYQDIKVLKAVDDVCDANVTMQVMESGADGVVFSSEDIEKISLLSTEVIERQNGKIKLVPCEIVELKHLEMGARACLDSTTMLSEKEGVLVGCTSSGGLLVCAEVHYLPYMNTRPFRVNAGTVSSYVWGPDNITEYISDLKAGSKLLAVDIDGNTRKVNIARVKIENRPLILIKVKYKDTFITCIMQDDWHMRLFSKDGQVVNITDLKKGDLVMGHVCEPGRHVGIKINENIREY